MHTSAQFLDLIRNKKALPSDYAVGKLLGVSTQQISRYRNGLDGFSDEKAEQVAGILGMEAGYVMACSHAQRSKKPAQRASWLRVAALLAASMLPPGASAAVSSQFDSNTTGIWIIRRRLQQFFEGAAFCRSQLA